MKKLISKGTFRQLLVAMLLISSLAVVAVVDSVTAAPSTTVTWKVSSLAPSQVINLSAMVSTNSPGVKTWTKKGSCTLTPTSKPTRLIMGSTGSCTLTLKIAKSKNYPAKSSTKAINLAIKTSTTVASIPTTTSAPVINTTVAPVMTTTTTTVRSTTTTTAAPSASAATVMTSGLAYTPTSVRISVGQSVAFDVSSSHDVRWQAPDTNPGRGATGAPYSRTFSNAGTYSFYCSIHSEMTGTITVG